MAVRRTFPRERGSPTGPMPGTLLALDTNVDGRPDLVVADTGAASVSVLVAACLP
jgi:hypothetical protein